jgi:hypothetical protein
MTAVLVSSITVIPQTETVEAATAVDEITVATCNNLDDIALVEPQVTYTWVTDDDATEEYIAKFEVKQDSFLYLAETQVSRETLSTLNGGRVAIYSDRTFLDSVIDSLSGTDEYACTFVKAGIYYLHIWSAQNDGTLHYKTPAQVTAAISVIPTNKVLTYDIKVNKNKSAATITFTNNIGNVMLKDARIANSDISDVDINASDWNESNDGVTKFTFDGFDRTTYKVTSNGTYTIRLAYSYNSWWDTYKGISYTIKVKGLDNTKPTVSGVKNKKTYTKAVTIKASDKGSGLKSATLNGKKIKVSKLKSGYKVSKAGTYTLKVTDKAGNTKTIKFTIKSAKKKSK